MYCMTEKIMNTQLKINNKLACCQRITVKYFSQSYDYDVIRDNNVHPDELLLL